MNIVEPIFLHCRGKPAEIALAAPGTDLNIVSYGRLARLVNAICHKVTSAGCAIGNRVAVFVEDPVLHAIILIALTHLGIVTISGRKRNFSWRFEIDAVITDNPFSFNAPKIILADANWATGDERPVDKSLIAHPVPEDLCRIFLTSGTTGEEKAIAVTNRMLSDRIVRQHLHFGSRLSFCSRIFGNIGLSTPIGFQMLLATLRRGGAYFMMGEPQATVSAMPIYRVEAMIASPAGMMEFLQAIESRPQYEPGFRAIWAGGGAMSSSLMDRVRARICPNFTFAYGSTEATMVASMPVQFGAGTRGAVGYVFPDINVEIIGEHGTPLPAGEEGSVRIKSKYGAREYMGDPEESAQVFKDGWFHPGDIGYLTKDNMLVISGRAKTVMNVGGEKLKPEIVEEVLCSHPNVVQAAVLTVPSEAGIDDICALIVPRSYLDPDSIRAHCSERLSPALIPSRFVTVSEIPRNEMGKIERAQLPALVRSKLN